MLHGHQPSLKISPGVTLHVVAVSFVMLASKVVSLATVLHTQSITCRQQQQCYTDEACSISTVGDACLQGCVVVRSAAHAEWHKRNTSTMEGLQLREELHAGPGNIVYGIARGCSWRNCNIRKYSCSKLIRSCCCWHCCWSCCWRCCWRSPHKTQPHLFRTAKQSHWTRWWQWVRIYICGLIL
jgi:hypothetical protein